jgi:multisubunit Na+/H+ antiporter MnhG subunit
MTTTEGTGVTNGAAVAAYLAAAIGAFAMGFIVILGEAGLFSAPSLYAPAGGVTGRTTLAAVIWLVAWVVLHQRWKDRQVDGGRAQAVSLTLIGLGVLLCFPPVWGLL